MDIRIKAVMISILVNIGLVLFKFFLARISGSTALTASRIYFEKMEKVLPKLRIYMVDKDGDKGVTSLRLMMPSSRP